MSNNIFILRPAELGDLPFVHKTFIEGGWPLYRNTPGDRKYFTIRVTRLLEKASILMLVDRKDPEVLYGYVVYSPDAVHWVYVKQGLRNHGFATTLLNALPKEVLSRHTHVTNLAQSFIKKHKSVYSPLVLERLEYYEVYHKDV